MVQYHNATKEEGVSKDCKTNLNDLVAEATELEPFMTSAKEVRRGL